MSTLASLGALVAEGPVGVTQNTGEQVTFWVCATLAVIGAGGTVLSRKAVHSALFIALTMINLAVLYVAQDAPFLGMVQVIVYTGAVMMLFVFVLMVVGVDASDSLVETLKGQRALGWRWRSWASSGCCWPGSPTRCPAPRWWASPRPTPSTAATSRASAC